MAAVPIYVWNGTAWQETGPTIPANPIKYQASAPSSPSTGDIWVDSDGDVTTGSQQFQRFRFVAVGGETTISGADANGAVLAYTAGLEQVVLNGAVLVRGYDYLATTGTTITGLSPALVASDVLEVFSFIAFTVANTYTQAQVDGLITTARAASGLVLLNTTSFSAQSTVSLPANTFSATYQNYMIVFNNVTMSTSDWVSIRLRAAGTDYSGSGYVRQFLTANSTSITGSRSAATTSWVNSYYPETSVSGYFSMILQDPFATQYTKAKFSNSQGLHTNLIINEVLGSVNTTTSYDSMSFIADSGTITGSISCYGFNK